MGEMVDRGEVLQRISLGQPISLSVLLLDHIGSGCDNTATTS